MMSSLSSPLPPPKDERLASSSPSAPSSSCLSSYSYTLSQTRLFYGPQFGIDSVNYYLRSVVMSPAAFTLFLGYHPSATVSVLNLKIQGLPTEIPNFLIRNNIHTRLSNAQVLKSAFDETLTTINKDKMDVDANDPTIKTELTGNHLADSSLASCSNVNVSSSTEDNDDDETDDDDDHVKEDQVKTAFLQNLAKRLGSIREHKKKKKTQGGRGFTWKISETIVSKPDQESKTKAILDLILMKKDMNLQDEKNVSTTKVPLGLVKFGLLKEEEVVNNNNNESVSDKLERLFWPQVGRALRHLRLLQQCKKYKWNNKETLLLLGVLVATRDCNKGRLAVFACEPRGNDGWRMALLWRAQLQSIDELSAAFGYYLNSLEYLENEALNLARKNETEWKYLGPDCSLVVMDEDQKFVLRSYDNRVHPDSRTPIVYKYWATLQHTTKQVLLVEDNDSDSDTLDFGVGIHEPEENKKPMLFSKWNSGDKKKGGKVEVIAVPYVDGTHVCRNLRQALFLLKYLKELQNAGFVHGDIRGRNVVFKTDSDEAVLIDFDLGGQADIDTPPRYPPGYKNILEDGRRSGWPNQVITKRNDARDVANVIVFLHRVPNDSPVELKALWGSLEDHFDTVDAMIPCMEKLDELGTVRLRPSRYYRDFYQSDDDE